MDNKRVETTYVAKLDKASYGRVSKELKAQSVDQVKSAKVQLGVQKDINAQLRKNVKEAEKANKERAKAVKQEKTRLEILEKQNTETRNRVGSVGDVDSSLSAIRGGTSAITGVNIPGLEQVAGVFELTEAVVQLKGAAPAAIESVKGLAEGLGPTGIGIAAVAGLAVAGVLAFGSAMTRASEEAAKAIEIASGGFKELKQEQKEGTLTTEEISVRLKELTLTYEGQHETLDALQAAYDAEIASAGLLGFAIKATSYEEEAWLTQINETKEEIKETESAMAGLRGAFESGKLAANDQASSLVDDSKKLESQYRLEQQAKAFASSASQETLDNRLAQIESEKDALLSIQETLTPLVGVATVQGKEATARFNDLATQISNLNTEAGLLTGTLGDNVRAREQEESASEAVKERAKELDAIQKQRESTLGRLNALESQSVKALDDFARRRAELTQDRQLRDLRELEDYNNGVVQANRDHQTDLADINRSGNEAIADINADIKDLQKDFYASEIDATNDYRKELKKLNRDYHIEDKQALDDHLASLRSAEQGNDVIAFLEAQTAFKKEQKEKEATRSEEFRDLNNKFNEERQLRQRDFNDRRQDLQREITLTRQQTQQKIQEAQQAFQAEQQLASQERQLKLQRQRQDDQIADQRAQQALQRQLAEINKKAQAEINAISQVTSAIGRLQAVANRIATTAGGGSSSGFRGGSSGGSTPLGQKSYEQNRVRGSARVVVGPNQPVRSGQRGFAFADGGIVDKPTLGLVGEGRRPEAIIPFDRSKGLPSALRDYGITPQVGRSGGAVVHLNFAPNLTVGDIATGNQVSQALQEFADDLTSQLDTGLKRAINQTA